MIISTLLIVAGCTDVQKNSYSFYIGTYTDKESKGIYKADFDPVSGEVSVPELVAEAENPSFLALDGDGHLFVVNEMISGEPNGGVSSYRITGKGLNLINTVSSRGKYPCYISRTIDGMLVAANYGSGSVIAAGVTEGTIDGNVAVAVHEGSGPDTGRQEGPHAHSISQHNNGYLYAADLGTDKIYVYSIIDGRLVLRHEVQVPSGSGPRHIAFHPTLALAYLINELNSTIVVYGIQENGDLQEKQIVGTLPEGWDGESYCADIHVHPNGKLLFGSNRGHDSIAAFIIDDDGNITPAGYFTEEVVWPRNFSITPDGENLIVANQNGNSLVVAGIDLATGAMTKRSRIEVPTPVCIQFEE